MCIIVPVVTLCLGAVLGTWYTEFARRPKLRRTGQSGGGEGPGVDVSITEIGVENRTGLIGLTIPPVEMFNKRWRGTQIGVPIDRHPAIGCTADLIDEETGQRFSLGWMAGTTEVDTVRSVDIPSGEKRRLLVLARIFEGPSDIRYGVPRSCDLSKVVDEMERSGIIFTTAPKKFTLMINHRHALRPLKMSVLVTERVGQARLRITLPRR